MRRVIALSAALLLAFTADAQLPQLGQLANAGAAIQGLLNGEDSCPQLTDAGVNSMDKQAIADACYTGKRDHNWNPCDKCLCAVTRELSGAGVDVSDTAALLGCGEKLASVMQYANVSRDDSIYLLTACPAKCRVSSSDGVCPKGCDRKTGWPLVYKHPRGYLNQQDYCDRALQFQASWTTDDIYSKSKPFTGNIPKGCIKGCILGMNLQDIYARTFNWDGKCFFPGGRVFNYREPGRNIVLEGENSLGQSWYDQETTMFLEYPDNWWWMFWTRIATLGQLWDYTIYHDEIRESPTPGLFMGLTYLYPFNTVNLSPFRVIGIRFALMQTAEGLWEYAVAQGNA